MTRLHLTILTIAMTLLTLAATATAAAMASSRLCVRTCSVIRVFTSAFAASSPRMPSSSRRASNASMRACATLAKSAP